ncbi:MAG: hypothetical protein AAB366_01915 [Patescibacteria group bacterium]
MHKEILTEEQKNLLPLVGEFARDFGLVGGTAIALNIGHRRSIDFDLFSLKKFDNYQIKRKISSKNYKIENIFKDEEGQYTFLIKGARFTFFHYPYKINFSEKFNNIVKLPNFLTLATMKAFTLSRRAKWKDYVDLYFIMRDYFSLKEISKQGKKIFGNEFNEKIFREALAYFKDINYDEKVIFMPGFKISDETIKKELIKLSLS